MDGKTYRFKPIEWRKQRHDRQVSISRFGVYNLTPSYTPDDKPKGKYNLWHSGADNIPRQLALDVTHKKAVFIANKDFIERISEYLEEV